MKARVQLFIFNSSNQINHQITCNRHLFGFLDSIQDLENLALKGILCKYLYTRQKKKKIKKLQQTKHQLYLVGINDGQFYICGIAHVTIAPEINWPQP